MLLLRGHHSLLLLLLLLGLHGHLGNMALLSKVGEILLVPVTLLVHALLNQSCRTLPCQLVVLLITGVTIVSRRGLRIVVDRLLVCALHLYGYIGKVGLFLRAGHRWHFVVSLYVGRHSRRLTRRFRRWIPGKMSNLKSRQSLLPSLSPVSYTHYDGMMRQDVSKGRCHMTDYTMLGSDTLGLAGGGAVQGI